MSNIVLATKWRPKLFSEFVGQDPVVTALVNSLDKMRLHHSYLFTGTRGVGKTTLARILAKCLNCETNGVSSKPCCNCFSCNSIDSGQFVDLYEVDAASRTKVEDTRELLENVQYLPTQGKYKIYLIDEVHMLSTHSFNALLKTLEEPPEHVKFVLATTDPQKIPSTILSRCLHFNLSRISNEIIQNQINKILDKENIAYEEKAINNISKLADGSMRDAISLTEQCISYSDKEITYKNVCNILCLMPAENINKIINMLISEDANSLLNFIDSLYYESVDFKNLLEEIISILHQSAIFKVTNVINDNIFEDSIKKISNKYSEEEVQILYQIAVSNLKDINFAPNYKSCFEMTMIRMLLFSPFNFEDSKSLKNLPVEHSPTKNSKKKDENEKVAKEKDGDLKNNIIESDKKMLSVEKNWDIVVKRLEIDGMTKNLANNILFESRRENNINFLISENLIKMATDKSINKLQEALSSFYGQKINIEISKSDSNLETLHKKNEDNYNARISDANEQIENDDFVKAIKEKFNAKTINNSTKINE